MQILRCDGSLSVLERTFLASNNTQHTRNCIYWHYIKCERNAAIFFNVLIVGRSLDQSDTLGADWSEPHETGKRHSDLAAQERCLSKQERWWEQRAQTSDLPGWSEGTKRRKHGQNKPDQVGGWIIRDSKRKTKIKVHVSMWLLLLTAHNFILF